MLHSGVFSAEIGFPSQRGIRMGTLPIDQSTSRSRVIPLLLLSVSMVSSASVLIKFSISPPLVIVFWRTLYGAIIMATVGGIRGDFKHLYSDQLRRTWPWLVAIGAILSFHFSTWFTSLFETTVAASVVLVNTSPIFTAIISTLVLGESLRRKSWAGVLIAVSGALILAWDDLVSQGFGALYGDMLALLSAFFLAIYFIGGRKFAQGMPITVYTSIVYFVAAMVTLLVGMMMGLDFMVFEPSEVAIFLALAIFPTALGHSVNNYLLTLVPAYVVSSAVLGEPIGATLLAIVFIGPSEIPGVIAFAGFCIILVGIALVLTDIAQHERKRRLTLDDSNGS
ncbi:MAG: DMT family transporter [Candidatus Thorarchaeota archaeon]|nr:DMT family transporter [Candidatus Thorarchaeota archaeon]